MSPFVELFGLTPQMAEWMERQLFDEGHGSRHRRVRHISNRLSIPYADVERAWDAALIFPPPRLVAKYAAEEQERIRRAESLAAHRVAQAKALEAKRIAEAAREAKRRAEEAATLDNVKKHYDLAEVYTCCRLMHASTPRAHAARLAAYRAALLRRTLPAGAALDRLVLAVTSMWTKRPAREPTRNDIREAVESRIRDAVVRAYGECSYRKSQAETAETTLVVRLGGRAGVEFKSGSRVTGFTRSGKIYASHHLYRTTVAVPWSWYRRVYLALNGDPTVDGQLILDVEPTDTPNVLRALVVSQERGLRVATRQVIVDRRTRFDRECEPSLPTTQQPKRVRHSRFDRDILPERAAS